MINISSGWWQGDLLPGLQLASSTPEPRLEPSRLYKTVCETQPDTFSGLCQFLQRPRKALAANCLEAEVKEVTFCQQDDSIGKNLQPRNPVVPYI